MQKWPLLLIVVSGLSVSAHAPAAAGDKENEPTLAKKYPGLRIEAKVGKRNKAVPGSSYMKTMTLTPEVVMETSTTWPVAAASATFLLITLDTRAKYTQRYEELTVASNETIDIAALDRGQRRNITLTPLTLSYDSDRDHTNIGGQVYKYYIMALFSDDKQFLHFETNCPPLAKYLAENPDERLKFLSLKPGEKFTTQFE